MNSPRSCRTIGRNVTLGKTQRKLEWLNQEDAIILTKFEVGDRVMLKVSPWKGDIQLSGKRVSLAPSVEPLRKCLGGEASLHVPLYEIKVDKTFRFVKEHVENSDREVKRLKCSRMVVVKVHLGSKARSFRLQETEYPSHVR
ncbi:hypothetical protein Tco_0222488 [Tanacetum coccineum]